MPYTDKDYFLNNIKQSELDSLIEDEDGTVNYDNLTAKISAADSLIDSYLASAVTLPLSTVPDIIKQCSFDIAYYYLKTRVDYKDVAKEVKDKYDAAISFLKAVANKTVSLPGVIIQSTDNSIQYDSEEPDVDRGSY